MSNLALRILTGLVGAPLVLGVVYLGGWPFAILVLVLALVAQHEYYRLAAAGENRPDVVFGLGVGALLALRPLFFYTVPAALALILLWIASSPFRKGEDRPVASQAATLFGMIYPVVFLSFLVDLRLARGPLVSDFDAFALTASTFLLVWATDTFAYFSGRTLGRHPLAPLVSPKKTWEGAVGGALGALIVAAVLKVMWLGFVPWVHIMAVALITGVVSQLGDLAESKMKRSVGVKDSGTILPGHGGLLDRFDAMILAAPLVYLYLAYVARLFDGAL